MHIKSIKIFSEYCHVTAKFSTTCSVLGNTVDEQIYYKRINEDIFGHLFNRNKPTAPASLPLSKSKKKTIKEEYPFENASKKKLLKSQEDINDTDDYLSFPRNYEVRLPSVSKIIQATMPPDQREILDRWEQNMIEELGEEGFRQYKEDLFRYGHELHYAVEKYFGDSGSLSASLEAEGDQTVQNMIQSLSPIIDDFQRPALSLESQVIHPTLNYVGYFDALAFHKRSDKIVLIDWKTSEKKKSKLQRTYDAPLQVAAYVGALNHDTRYPFQIESALIVVVNKKGSVAEVFPLTKRQLKIYWTKWVARCEQYAQMTSDT